MGHENPTKKRRPPAGSQSDDPVKPENGAPSSSGRREHAGSTAGAAGAEEAPGGLPDMLRRAMAMGLSGFFTTEEALRKALGDTLPRDWVDFANDQSERTRAELMQRMSEEFGRVLEKMDLAEVMDRLLAGRTIEVTAQIRLGDRDAGKRGASSEGTTRTRVAEEVAEDP